MPTTERDLARHLIAHTPTDDSSYGAAGPTHAACVRLSRELARSIGAKASEALFSRALASVQIEHRSLEGVRLDTRPESCLDGVEESIREHGEEATAEGIGELLAAVLGLLGRLLGRDMVVMFVTRSAPNQAPADGSTRQRET
ncbi:MAG: hypothetical protein ACREV5_20965 [Steroidobacter sp.]